MDIIVSLQNKSAHLALVDQFLALLTEIVGKCMLPLVFRKTSEKLSQERELSELLAAIASIMQLPFAKTITLKISAAMVRSRCDLLILLVHSQNITSTRIQGFFTARH